MYIEGGGAKSSILAKKRYQFAAKRAIFGCFGPPWNSKPTLITLEEFLNDMLTYFMYIEGRGRILKLSTNSMCHKHSVPTRGFWGGVFYGGPTHSRVSSTAGQKIDFKIILKL